MNEELIEISVEQIGESLKTINECLQVLGKRLQDVENYISEIPTPDKTYYKPEAYKDYMNLKENFDEIYKRLGKIEDGM